MKVLGIITARGGSKGIPRKNLTPLCGKSLLQWTSDVAHASDLSDTVLSTDDSEIAEAGKALGIEVPFMRPEELAQDNTPTIPVLQDVITKLATEGREYDAVLTLQPTNPLRQVSDINGAIKLLSESGAESVIAFVDVGEKHPARMKWIDEEGRIKNPEFAEAFEGQRRQDLPKIYLREGSIYLTRTDVLMEKNSLQGDDCRAWLIEPERAVNIDIPFDLVMAEALVKYHGFA